MKSKVIKFVAGGGKTTFSKEYFLSHEKGIYLAFTNSVVDDLKCKGILCKTLDSFISSYVVPKFLDNIEIFPIMPNIRIVETENLKDYQKGIGSISIDKSGKIYCKSKLLPVDIHTKNEVLHSMHHFSNLDNLKLIFGIENVLLTQTLRTDIASYIINNYQEEIVLYLKERFDFIIVDEAQDIKKGHLEDFAKLLYNSDFDVLFLGDSNQNVNGGSNWFELLDASEVSLESHRCPENNCEWIRDVLGIMINGNSDKGGVALIEDNEIKSYDNGKRCLLYKSKSEKYKEIINNWSGRICTIQSAKGETINEDIVIVGKSLNKKMMYTAVTRTKGKVFHTIKRIN